MKNILKIMLIVLLLASLWMGSNLTAYGAVSTSESIEPGKTSSLTLQYRHNGMVYEGLTIKTYRIADVNVSGNYYLTQAFRHSSVNLNQVKSQSEWKTIATTLAAYAASEGLSPDCSAQTDSTGTVYFRNLQPGMYLTLAVSHTGETEITSFETFLMAVPYPDVNGIYNYDVTAFPKCSSKPLNPEKVEYKVIKLWKDTGFSQHRPEKIRVRILKDGKVNEIQTLSSENNWSYSWTAEDDGSIWQVSEIAISAGYTVTITETGKTFILTNTHEELEEPEDPDPPVVPDEPDVPDIPVTPDGPDDPYVPDVPDGPDSPDTPDTPEVPDDSDKPETPDEQEDSNTPEKPQKPSSSTTPKTGDMTVIWPYVLAMAISGSLLLILAIWRMRSE